MQIHELPTISGSPSGGYFATDNGTQTTKIDYTALAQAIIEQYNASTLAGSAQSVKAALDGIGELAYAVNYKGMGRIAQNDDLNSYTTPGSYVATSTGITTSLTNCPINNSGFSLHVESVAGGTGQLLIQTIKRTSSNIGEVYLRTYTGSVWGAWEKVPTRAEVDALNSKVLGHIGKEILTNANIYSAYGWITGGKKNLFLIIPLNLTDDLSTATIASLKVGLRLSTGGYAFGADNKDVTSMITRIVVNKREGVLRVEITSDTDICDTNNICCAGTANLTATFS